MVGSQLQPDRRIELILHQLESLPTLSGVALRLLELTASDESETREVVRLVGSDPALASRVLKMCRCGARSRAASVATIERAVVLVGFDAVRAAALAVKVFEAIDSAESPGGEMLIGPGHFDRRLFWRHSLAVAVAAESLAESAPSSLAIAPAEAFLAGLLHDLGFLALHVVLPRSFDRVCELAETRNIPLDHAAQKVVGMDGRTAGKRLAEHWRLPYSLVDAIWLHGQPLRSLPNLGHRRLVALVSLADAVVRSQHITPLGHGPRHEHIAAMAAELNIKPPALHALLANLANDVAARSTALGMDASPATEIVLRSISRANDMLVRLNIRLRDRAEIAQQQSRTLAAIRGFHDATSPGLSPLDCLEAVARSAIDLFGEGFCCILYQDGRAGVWRAFRYGADGRMLESSVMNDIPTGLVIDAADESQFSLALVNLLPDLKPYLSDAADFSRIRIMPLRCGWGAQAILLHECLAPLTLDREQLDALARTWAAAIAAAAQDEGVRRLGEKLADANLQLIETQESLTRSRAMASVGEVAAGVAHEMNNPLTVISGRSQILASRLTEPDMKNMAEQIAQQSHRLSDMITALRDFAQPIRPQFVSTSLDAVLALAVDRARDITRWGGRIDTTVPQPLQVSVDPQLLADALVELLKNAIETGTDAPIELRASIDELDDRLILQVIDQGPGLTPHALAHAFDPFFSAKPAGRQPGHGLGRARRLIETHDGEISIENGSSSGAMATIRLGRWRDVPSEQRGVA